MWWQCEKQVLVLLEKIFQIPAQFYCWQISSTAMYSCFLKTIQHEKICCTFYWTHARSISLTGLLRRSRCQWHQQWNPIQCARHNHTPDQSIVAPMPQFNVSQIVLNELTCPCKMWLYYKMTKKRTHYEKIHICIRDISFWATDQKSWYNPLGE